MKIKVSKILDATFARATFDLSKAHIRHSYKDHLALEILRNDSTMAYNILTLTLKNNQIKQITSEISKLITERPIIEHQAADEFLTDYRASLIERFTDTGTLSSLHLLLDIITDNSTATAHVLEMYGVSTDLINYVIATFDNEIIWESKMQNPNGFDYTETLITLALINLTNIPNKLCS